MSGQTRFYAFANGVKLHYLERGAGGPDVLLIPGITSPAITWAFVADRIAEFAHVYVMDTRGRGLSDQRPGLSYTLDDYAADADGLLESLGLKSAILLGHSMGGRIGIRMAARYPGRVKEMILVDPPISGPGRRPYPMPLQYYLDNLDKAQRGEPIQASPRWNEQQVRLRAEWLPTCSIEAIAASHRGLQDEDIHGDLQNIRCKTLLIYAEQGGTISDADAAEFVGKLSGGSKMRLDGVGHMIPFDDLELFMSAIRPAIAR
jgi:N-formylmaleamate deformylase